MAGDSSFDVVSKVDHSEVDNAVRQTAKEVSQRFDFKGVGATIEWHDDAVVMAANDEQRVLAVLDVFQSKLIKRGVSLKAVDTSDPKLSGKTYRITATLKDGLDQEHAKSISKLIRDQGPKGVKVQIVGDELRVSSKNRDDLQTVIGVLKKSELDVALQFINYR